MKLFLLSIFFAFALNHTAFSQALKRPNCDSTILNTEEFEKCKADTANDADVFHRINYITFLKSELLPRYRSKRIALTLPPSIAKDVKQLRRMYDSTVTAKIAAFTKEMDKNQRYVQPKAYLASTLSFETFKIYPDVYAILLNPIHLALSPKTSSANQKRQQKLIMRLYNSVVGWNNPLVWRLTEDLIKEKKSYSISPGLFQGSIDEEERRTYDIVNFLMWME